MRILILSLIVIGAVLGFWLAPRDANTVNEHLYVVKIPHDAGIVLRPVLAKKSAEKSEKFGEIVERVKPYAAINGTFFDPQLKPLGDIVANGKLINHGHYPNAVAMKKTGEIVFVRRGQRGYDWRGYQSALAAGPRLVHNGSIKLDMNADGFTKKGLVLKAPRSGIGITRTGDLLLIVEARYVTLGEFAKTMLDQGAVEAMNLDGGPACGLYKDGEMLVTPSLRMTNVLLVIKRG